MSLISETKFISESYKSQIDNFEHNHQLLDIYDGNLVKYVLADLQKELSAETYDEAKFRVAPVNVLRRLIEKLAKLYNKPPMRIITPDDDKDILDFYVKSFDLNTIGSEANEYFNLFRNTALEPYLDSQFKPRLRVLPSDRFFVLSNNSSDPMQVTHFIKYMGVYRVNNIEKSILWVYTDNEFLIIDTNGEIQSDMMNIKGSDGTNPYGKIPFVYSVKSRQSLNPPADQDTLAMTKLFPILMTDLNYAVKFQCFSIIYGVNVDEENLKLSPNVFWRFKSDATTGGEPKIGTIKPEVDSDKVLALIQSIMSMWLQSKNIRPGAVGQLNTENFSSGISKMVDEMDTVEERQRQVSYFKKLEEDLWSLVINHMHPIWSRSATYELKRGFSPGASVMVQFTEQLPMQDRNALLDTCIKEIKEGLTTKKIALKKLNPEMSDEEIDLLLKEINEENTVEVIQGEEINGEQVDSEDDRDTTRV